MEFVLSWTDSLETPVSAWAPKWIISRWEGRETAPFNHSYPSPLETLLKRTHLWMYWTFAKKLKITFPILTSAKITAVKKAIFSTVRDSWWQELWLLTIRGKWIRGDTEYCISRPTLRLRKKEHNLISCKVKSRDLRLQGGNLREKKNVANWTTLVRKFTFRRLLYWSAHADFIHW